MKADNNMRFIFIFMLVAAGISMSVSAQMTITEFNASLSSINLSYPYAYTSNEYFIRLPEGTVSEARMRIQGLDIFGQAILPADVMLVTDVSGSMGSYNKMNDAKAADISFLNNVNLNYIHMGLVHYSAWGAETASQLRTGLDIHLTDDGSALESEIDDYFANGYTNMGGGMELAMDDLLGSYAQDTDRKYMLVMTDGIANCYPYDYSNYDLTDTSTGYCIDNSNGRTRGADYVRYIAEQCKENNITIFGIAFGSDANTALMQEISSTTGGQYYFAPDAATLLSIYNQIAQSISYQDFPTPRISSTDPVSMDGWEYPNQYSLDTVWDGADCGSPQAVCIDYRAFLQANIDACNAYPCDVLFSAYSSTFGQLTLSDLYIEINEPPVGNFPPYGNCRSENLVCGDTNATVDIDDGSIIQDPNDDLDTLTWTYEYSLVSSGGSHFLVNSDFDTTRRFIATVDPAFLEDTYWEVFLFNVSDPWGESTESCVNVSYEGCMSNICGDNNIGTGEDCDDGLDGNGIPCSPPYGSSCTYCSVSCTNITLVGEGCGDGILNETYEECDDGTGNGVACTPSYGSSCTYCSASCTNVTVAGAGCGDGTINGDEECDDGLGGNGVPCSPIYGGSCIYCSDACKNVTIAGASCGDGTVNGPEECEPSDAGSCYTGNCYPPGSALECRCVQPLCGNGVVEWGEDCDTSDASACSSGSCYAPGTPDECSCVPDSGGPICGDGNIDPGESCEPSDASACSSGSCYAPGTPDECNCVPDVGGPFCGDGNIDPGESCEPGNAASCASGACYSPGTPDECHCIPSGYTAETHQQFTLKNVDFQSVDLYKYVEDAVWDDETKVHLLSWSPDPPSNLDLEFGTNVVKARVKPDWTGWEEVGFVMTDGVYERTVYINFTVLDVPDYDMTTQDTRLLVAKGKLITNYYEDGLIGDVAEWGPYIITIKVWEKKR